MTRAFDGTQRIVLHGTPWRAARHLMLGFGNGSAPRRLLQLLLKQGWPSGVGHGGQGGADRHRGHSARNRPLVQVSIGLTRRGLERAGVPAPVLTHFALKSPAYWAGASLRAAGQLGMSGSNAAERWAAHFGDAALDAVLSVHAADAGCLHSPMKTIECCLRECRVTSTALPEALALDAPPGMALPGQTDDPRALQQWVHFGYRDGLARVGIEGVDKPEKLAECQPTSRHQAGEFLLGHGQDSGANPWLAGPGRQVWPAKMRGFFCNGSFGVLQQVEQDVAAFEAFVQAAAQASGLPADVIKGKLCGRSPAGRPLAMPDGSSPLSDFHYGADPHGHGCPFGSHVRRMNPRLPRRDDPAAQALAPLPDDSPAHSSRTRPLLRRGLPYGPAWPPSAGDGPQQRGLIAQFFCASIEDQFEHLLGEWAERVPLGSPDGGGARDPLIGSPEAGDGPFEIPRVGAPALQLQGLGQFTRTVGAAYLFYPSLPTLAGIADDSLWGLDDVDDDA